MDEGHAGNLAAARLLLAKEDIDARIKDHEGAFLFERHLRRADPFSQVSRHSTSTTRPSKERTPPTPCPPRIPVVKSSSPGERTETLSSALQEMAIEHSPSGYSSSGKEERDWPNLSR